MRPASLAHGLSLSLCSSQEKGDWLKKGKKGRKRSGQWRRAGGMIAKNRKSPERESFEIHELA